MSALRVMATCALALACLAPAAQAQQTRPLELGAGGGGTYYCIVSRCNTGTTLGATATLRLTPAIGLDATVRRHFCFDCDRYLLGEAGVLLRVPGRALSPFAAAGASLSSDPEFFGDELGVFAGVGAWLWRGEWGGRIELRGRRVRRGDALGELSLSIARAFGRPGA